MAEGKQVRIEPEAYETLKEVSEEAGVPMSAIISRVWLDYYADVKDTLEEHPGLRSLWGKGKDE